MTPYLAACRSIIDRDHESATAIGGLYVCVCDLYQHSFSVQGLTTVGMSWKEKLHVGREFLDIIDFRSFSIDFAQSYMAL
ncbi:unnamed protein product [Cylicocyclus nassatus]|uniref:Uncharacterized protein n=1 Tax=Cylicocyclus nassatus TaxID=53992 RepID=A0AA36GUH1_CYLNA|nr:unnamed protein product [Cylicocyclus nassatus]